MKMIELKRMCAIVETFDAVLNKLTTKQEKPSGYETTIDINGYEFDCIVDYEIEPACKGGRGDFGMQTESDSPATINMGQIWIFDNKWQISEIPEQAMKDVLDEILEHELS